MTPEATTAVQGFVSESLKSYKNVIDTTSTEVSVASAVTMFTTIGFLQAVLPDLRERAGEYIARVRENEEAFADVSGEC